MQLIKAACACLLAAFVAGCTMSDDVTRNATVQLPLANVSESDQFLPTYTVKDVRISVPLNLSVSEANSIKPRADIVWRGDLGFDRHEQLRVLFEEAAAEGAELMQGEVDVIVDLTITKFHGMTQHSRYAYKGDYDIHYTYVVREVGTERVIEGPTEIEVSLVSTPEASIFMDASGYTERQYVKDYLIPLLTSTLTH